MRVTLGDSTVEGIGHDVSVGGLCVDAPLKAAVGEPVVVAFTLGGADLELDGHVRWIREDFIPRLGVELAELTRQQTMHLSEFVALHNLPRTGDTLESMPAVPVDPDGPSQAPLVRPNLEPVRGRRAAIAISYPPPPEGKEPREGRPAGGTRHHSLHLDDPDG